jgi:hypothetical protein
VISIVLYHSGPTSGEVLHSCQKAFVVDASDYSGHLIRHLLNASEAFPTEWFFFNFESKSKSGGLMSALYSGWGRPRVIVQNEDTGCEHGGHFWRIFGRKTSCRNFL